MQLKKLHIAGGQEELRRKIGAEKVLQLLQCAYGAQANGVTKYIEPARTLCHSEGLENNG